MALTHRCVTNPAAAFQCLPVQARFRFKSRSHPLQPEAKARGGLTMAAVRLLDLFRDPDHDVDRIVECISQDPLLAAETLKRATGPLIGAPNEPPIFLKR